MKNIRLAIGLFCSAMLLGSCNDFLDERPSKSTNLPVTTVEQLDAILARYTDFCAESNVAAVSAHDDYGFPVELYDAQPMIFYPSSPVLQAAFWEYDILKEQSEDDFWSGNSTKQGEYSKIFRANMVLESLDDVEGSEEDKARLRAEAHFIRAYSHWNLVNVYGLPYTEANASEPGIPLKRSTSFEESSARATLEATYSFIESELQEALKCTTPLMQEGTPEHWRANTAAINGFAARFYLNCNDYEQALHYAEEALKEYDVLVDYNTEMSEEDVMGANILFPSTFDISFDNYTKIIGWKEFLYMRLLYAVTVDALYFPSQELLDMYDKEHDLRYRYHVVEGVMETMYNSSVDYPIYVFFTLTDLPSGPTTAEMYLIKAECQARLGDYMDAMETVNALRAKRLEPGDWVNLQADSQQEAIMRILEERRREMPFAQRWFDIRRLNNNETEYDDVADITKEFHRFTAATIYGDEEPITYTLEKNSRKYALPLNENEIELSNGALHQNAY